MPLDSDTLVELVERRHPEYYAYASQWDFLESTYKGGRSWFYGNIHKYFKEGEKEYRDRIERSYRFNHSREVVDLLQKYISKGKVSRKQDSPDQIHSFWKNSTLSGLDIKQFMDLVSRQSSIFGRIWVVVDAVKTNKSLTKAEEKEKYRVYTYTLKPQDVLDFGFDDIGGLNWILVRELYRKDNDPFNPKEAYVEDRYRLWTKEKWYLISLKQDDKGKKQAQIVEEGDLELGVIPIFYVDHVIGDNKYVAPSLIGDIAYLDKAIANYLSNLDAIIQDQTFSQLAIPAQNLISGKTTADSVIEMGTKRIFVYDGESNGQPFYLSPDPKQASVILEVINKIINEIYHSVGLAGERTKQDNSVGIDNSSGVAKAYDFERINSLLVSKAGSLENAENKLVNLVSMYYGVEVDEELVKYPETFDVRGLYDEFTIAERLSLISAPNKVRQEQMKQVVDKLFPDLSAKLIEEIKKEIEDNWLEDLGKISLEFSQNRQSINPQTQSRQGQVTSNTE